jgi:hypothetical protein
MIWIFSLMRSTQFVHSNSLHWDDGGNDLKIKIKNKTHSLLYLDYNSLWSAVPT